MSNADYTVLGEIDFQLLGGEFGILKTKIVIVTNERLEHIERNHPQDIELFRKYASAILETPDIIIKDLKNSNTVFLIKTLQETNLNVIIKLAVDSDSDDIQNSVMTFFRIRQKNLKKLEKKNKILYKRE